MAFDYDLVIIGGSMTARHAAAKACRLQARVALVEPDTPHSVALPLLQHCAARQLRSWVEQTWKTATWELGQGSIAPPQSLSWEKSRQWLQEMTEMIATNEIIGYSLAQLAAIGVDVVLGQAAFYPQSRRKQRSNWRSNPLTNHPPVVLVNGRYLRSRRYLLAPHTQAIIPEIEGLATIAYRTIDSCWQHPWQVLPQRLIILGSDPRGLELAQLFNDLGCQVSLIVSGNQLLPNEETQSIALLQAHLEAEGIEILTQTHVTQVKQLDDQIWLQAGDRALQTDALLLATQPCADLAAFNLEAVGVKGNPGIRVNRKLQTTNPYIFACGEVLGGYALAHLADHEAEVALGNALFFATSHVSYEQIPWVVFTNPPLARIGLTASQARASYGEDVIVLEHSLQALSRAQVQQETIGLCQLVVRRSGEILGAYSLSPHAEEWIGVLALAMKQKVKLGAIDPASFIASTFSEVLAQLIRQWHSQRVPAWQRDLLESWFNWRRS